ncbi:MAG TPA: response regulator [Candidatus Limnocylindria bacterium]|nr:response regulator [Candidatus Limnocylindria bacterium]
MSDKPTTDARAKRILVINDTQEILELFEEILTAMGHEVTLLSYAPDELRQIEEADPDLVIVDFVIGGREMEGWQLLQKMRMNRSTQHIPIIACTAAQQAVREQEGYLTQQGIAIVLKPFNVVQLENAVRMALKVNESSANQ